MKCAELIVKTLERYGVSNIFGIPGDATPFFRALAKSPIKFITMRDERHAGFAADAYGRISGAPGVVYVSRGPGGTNALTGIACSFLEGSPTIFIVDQVSRKDCVHRRTHMFVDFETIYEPISKGVDLLWNAKDTPMILAKAWADSQTTPKGPRCIIIPQDVFNEETHETYIKPIFPNKNKDGSYGAALRLAELIEKRKQPVLVLGPGVKEHAKSGELEEIIDHLSIPFFTTRHAKGIIPESNPLNYGVVRSNNLSSLSSEIDLVITIGHDVTDKANCYLWWQDRSKIAHINITDFPSVETWWFRPSEEFVVDWRNFFNEVLEQIPPGHNPKKFLLSSDEWLNREKETAIKRFNDNLLWRILGEDCLGTILTREDILLAETGITRTLVLAAYRAPGPIMISSMVLASIGFCIPASVGASLAKPGAKIVAICGDGGFLMGSSELATIRHLGLPVKIIMVADGSYGYIKHMQYEAFDKCTGVDFTNPEFEYLARAFKFEYLPVHTQDDLSKIPGAIASQDKPSLIVLYQKYNY